MMRIARIDTLPTDFAVLEALSRSEGFAMLTRLRMGLQTGDNRFQGSGEGLWAASNRRILVGIGGLNIDPYLDDPTVGRLRHLYVHPRYRRQGIGAAIVSTIEAEAHDAFTLLRLFTPEAAAARFYVGLGFAPMTGEHVSHGKILG